MNESGCVIQILLCLVFSALLNFGFLVMYPLATSVITSHAVASQSEKPSPTIALPYSRQGVAPNEFQDAVCRHHLSVRAVGRLYGGDHFTALKFWMPNGRMAETPRLAAWSEG
jgi:hypothetical protein